MIGFPFLYETIQIMKQLKISVLCAAVLTWNSLARAADWYVSQNGSGNQSGYNATNTQTLGWLCNSANWAPATGSIASGDTVHLCGVITATVGIFGSGVTVLFETGSSIAVPVGQCIYAPNVNNVTINGAGVGIIENTANGTGLANQIPVDGILLSGAGNITVENLVIANLYVRTNIADTVMDGAAGGGVYANGMIGPLTVANCTFSNIGWCVNLSGPQTTIEISSNTFANYDHGVGLGVSGTVVMDISSNIFGTTACWDSGPADAYHHDGIHYFGTATVNSFTIRNNLFDGDWGSNNTAHIYLETGPANVSLYNNVFIEYPGDYLADGFLCAYGASNQVFNNTFLGSAYPNFTALTTGGQGTVVMNNIFTSVTTFITSRSASIVYANNVYANQIGAGNAPWSQTGTAYNSLSAWQAAIGDTNMSYSVSSVPLNADGSLVTNTPGNPAIGTGTNLSGLNLFSNDFRGYMRGSSWDIGAFAAYGTIPPVVLYPPQNLHIVTAAPVVPGVTNFMINTVSLGSGRNDATLAVGRKFTVGSANITIIQLGRWVTAGNNQTHVLSICDRTGNVLGSVTVNTAGATPGAFLYAPLSPPVPLTAGSTYCIFSSEVAGQDQWYDNNTSITLQNGDTVAVCSAYMAGGVATSSSGGTASFGPVDAQYTKP